MKKEEVVLSARIKEESERVRRATKGGDLERESPKREEAPGPRLSCKNTLHVEYRDGAAAGPIGLFSDPWPTTPRVPLSSAALRMQPRSGVAPPRIEDVAKGTEEEERSPCGLSGRQARVLRKFRATRTDESLIEWQKDCRGS